jgi:transcriptional regulator with XRE-family HTH domain
VIVRRDDPPMDLVRFGAAIRAIRLRGRLRQEDVARRARVSRSTVARVETGAAATLSLETLGRIAAAVGGRAELQLRWRGGDLDRLLDAGHAAMHEEMATLFAGHPGWVAVPEASFSVYGERGIVDILAWHAERRVVLVVELKTQLVDLSEMLGTLDRKRRLAPLIARERGWDPVATAVWLVLADTPSVRARVHAHREVLRGAFPSDGRRMRAWLREPRGSLQGLSFLRNVHPRGVRLGAQRVSRQPARIGGPSASTTEHVEGAAVRSRPPR